MLKQVQHDIFLCFSLYDTAARGGGFTWKTIFYLCFRVEYIEAPITGEDITQAEILISVGQGIGGPEHIPLFEKLAKDLGGTISCSRPVVDRNWLPKERQVGISGKTVKPKAYLAIGISGAFQHVTAMQGSDTIIAINKDPRALIFGVAHYGIVDDFQNVIPILKEKTKSWK